MALLTSFSAVLTRLVQVVKSSASCPLTAAHSSFSCVSSGLSGSGASACSKPHVLMGARPVLIRRWREHRLQP